MKSAAPRQPSALEVSGSSEALRAECAKLYAGWQSLIGERLIELGFARERAAILARFVLSSLEGALLIGKIERSGEPVRDVARVLVELLAGSGV